MSPIDRLVHKTKTKTKTASALPRANADAPTSPNAVDRFSSLSVFVRAAETRSFTEAGRQLGISASAIGKAIFRLEGRLGVRLFHRSTRSVTLTPEGELFLARGQRIIDEIEAAEAELAAMSGVPRGRLRVSIPMVGTLLMPVICAFIKTFPDITLDIDFSDRHVDIIEEGFDIVMRTGEVNDSQLLARLIGNYRHVIVGSPDYLAQHEPLTIPLDLLHHACLQHRFPTTGKLRRWPLRDANDAVGIDLPTAAIATAVEPLIAMAEQGLGLACVPDFTVRRQMKQGTLLSVLHDQVDLPSAFRALWPSSRQLTPKVRVFIDYMSEHLFPELPTI
jgi:DNA-binding transcriptional LysR family regulator